MHNYKNRFLMFLVLILMFTMSSCAGSKEEKISNENQNGEMINILYKNRAEDKQKSLEDMFASFLQSIRNGATADELYHFLTDTSEYWLDTLERHAITYDSDALDTCQFYEAYSIILYRLYEREHLWESEDDRMLFMLLNKSGMLDRFMNLPLGPLKIKNDRGSIGLEKSPEVPIMLFEWDDKEWKLNLPQTMPLITKGIESIAVKKNWTNKKLALYWIEKEYHMVYSRLDESLFTPIGF